MKPWKSPSPEQLAAFADGELDAATRANVAAWLAEHPDAAADLEAQRRLERLLQASPPPEPSEAEWSIVLERIALAAQQPALPLPVAHRTWLPLRVATTVGLTAAAAVMVAMLLRTPPTPNLVSPQPQPVVVVNKALPVAADEDVEIVSVDAADIQFLVVGEPPMRGLVVLVAPGDIVLDSVEPDPTDGMMPKMRGMDMNNLDGPMIVAPLTVAGSRP